MPTTIHVTCGCGREYSVPDQYAGKRIKCVACGQPVQVPAAEISIPAVVTNSPSGLPTAPVAKPWIDVPTMLGIGVVVMTALNVAQLVVAQRAANSQRPAAVTAPAASTRSIETQQLVIKSDTGETRAVFGMMQDRFGKQVPGIQLLEQGVPRLFAHLQSNGWALITLRDLDNRERVSISHQSVRNRAGKLEGDDEAEIAVQSNSETPVVGMRAWGSGTGALSLFQGAFSRIECVVPNSDTPPYSVPSISFFDVKGKTKTYVSEDGVQQGLPKPAAR